MRSTKLLRAFLNTESRKFAKVMQFVLL